MKIEEVKSKTDTELVYELEQVKKELFQLRFKATTAASTNPARIRLLRRTIARMNTVIGERARGLQHGSAS